ncbi:MAG: type II secretion system F family protein [Dehalococcoidales bacterium]|nr:type II secretion system F family protein [Dehalococcoidales bacterium]
MEYTYTAYTKDNRLVKGKLEAASQEAAAQALNFGGYQVINLKQVSPFINFGGLTLTKNSAGAKDVLMFSRQLALLLESGTDLVSSLELLQKQITVKILQKILTEVIHDIRSGSSFSAALSKHPKTFNTMYCQAMAAGEQAGNLDVVLRQMSEYLEREVTTGKKVKNALTYPIMIFVLAIAVVAVLSIFVLPTFVQMFSSFGATLPLATRILMGLADWLSHYIIYIIIVLAIIGVALWAYIRTPGGRLWWDTLSLHLPVLGRVNILNELSRCCRTMSLLFKVGLPLPEILAQAIRGSGNKAFSNALTEVQEQLIRGEGLSKPMSRNPLFLPLMVQMVGVGEETGNLDTALTTVALSYEQEADDRTSAMVGMIQPVLTIGIALIIGFVAVAMISAMYGVYGQISL